MCSSGVSLFESIARVGHQVFTMPNPAVILPYTHFILRSASWIEAIKSAVVERPRGLMVYQVVASSKKQMVSRVFQLYLQQCNINQYNS